MEWQYLIDDVRESLREELRAGRLVIAVGAGVSRAVANTPDWHDAVRLACNHALRANIVTAETMIQLQARLETASSTRQLIELAHDIRQLLQGASEGSGEFSSWLETTFGDIRIIDPSLIAAIHDLSPSLLITTNYDKLLSQCAAGFEAVSWQDANSLARSLRGNRRIVHLHGRWDDPESVVFGTLDYDNLMSAAGYRDFFKALWLERTILFVGCSLDGLADPDLERMLEWVAQTFPHTPRRHYMLVRKGTATIEKAQLFLTRWRVQLIEYGDSYKDLAPFLSSMRDVARPSIPVAPSWFTGRKDDIASVRRAVEAKTSILIQGMAGIGKSTLVAKSLEELRDEDDVGTHLWIDGDVDSVDDMLAAIGQAVGLREIEQLSREQLLREIANVFTAQNVTALVLDGVTHPGMVRHLLSMSAFRGISVICTSQLRIVGFDSWLELDLLGIDDSTELFQRICEVANGSDELRDINQILLGHPLAIVVAAGRVYSEDWSVEEFLERLRNKHRRLNLLRDPETVEDKETSVRASLALALEDLPLHLELPLSVLAHFDSVVTPDLLAMALSTSIEECEDILGRLIFRSIVQRDRSGAISQHTLLKDVVKHVFGKLAEVSEHSVSLAFANAVSAFEDDVGLWTLLYRNFESASSYVLSTTVDSLEIRRRIAAGLAIIMADPDGMIRSYAPLLPVPSVELEVADRAVILAKSLHDREQEVHALRCFASAVCEKGDYITAIEVLEAAQKVAEGCNAAEELLASVLCQMGNLLMRVNQYADAEHVLTTARKHAIASLDPSLVAQTTGQLAHVFLLEREHNIAEPLYREALEIYDDLGFSTGVAACLANLAEIAEQHGDRAEFWRLNVESFARDLMQQRLTGALNSLEVLAHHVSNHEHLDELRQLIIEYNNALPVGALSQNKGEVESLLGAAYANLQDWDAARLSLTESLEARRARNDVRGEAVILGRLSLIALAEKDFPLAASLNQQSEHCYLASNDPRGVFTCIANDIVISAAVGDMDRLTDRGFEAVRFAAFNSNLPDTFKAFMSMMQHIMPTLDEGLKPQFPDIDGSFEEVMTAVVQAANDKNLERVLGSVSLALTLYGPGGVPLTQEVDDETSSIQLINPLLSLEESFDSGHVDDE